MSSFGPGRDYDESTERGRRDPVPAPNPQVDPRLFHVLALQQSAGNAAVSRLLQRQDGGAPAPPPAAAPAAPAAAPAGGGNDALLAMTRVAWSTGVLQRERDAAAALHRPKAGKRELQEGIGHLDAAQVAADQIGAQLGAIDPPRQVRANVHENAIVGDRNSVVTLLGGVTPADIADAIEKGTIPSGERALNDLTAPLPASGAPPSAAPPPAAPAPAPTPAPSAPIPAGP